MYHKWRSYDVWFLRHGAWQTEFLVILGHFFPYTPLPTEKSKFWKNEKKTKKKTGDTIILHLCTTNDNNMMYGWDMEHEEHNFLSFWTIICPFTPKRPRKSKFRKNIYTIVYTDHCMIQINISFINFIYHLPWRINFIKIDIIIFSSYLCGI